MFPTAVMLALFGKILLRGVLASSATVQLWPPVPYDLSSAPWNNQNLSILPHTVNN